MDKKQIDDIDKRRIRGNIGSLAEYTAFLENAYEDMGDLIAALRGARKIIIDTDAMYNENGERNDYETAAVAVQMMAGHGRSALTECEELKRKLEQATKERDGARGLMKNTARILGCQPESIAHMAAEVVNERNQALAESAQISDLMVGCGFELYQDGDRIGLRGHGTIYFMEAKS
jgi:hypothetical protein